jgi:predicted nucleic acid-binding protein
LSEIAIDASLALQWFLEDEVDRGYSLVVLQNLSKASVVVPILWFYEVGNGLTMAVRRQRITIQQRAKYLARIPQLPISADQPDRAIILSLPDLAYSYDLTNYDAPHIWSWRCGEKSRLPPPMKLCVWPPAKRASIW